jgi:hypothetical protein
MSCWAVRMSRLLLWVLLVTLSLWLRASLKGVFGRDGEVGCLWSFAD